MKILRVDTQYGFKLEARLKEEIVGIYNVPFDKSGNISHAYISSKIPNKKIPRNLINVVIDEIQRTANQERREITHEEYLVTDDSKKLSLIFEDLKYKKIEYPQCIVLLRTYKPGSPRN